MSFFSKVGGYLSQFVGLVKKAFVAAASNGLTDKLIADTLVLVKAAALKYVDSADRRNYVIGQLVKRGVPESIARLAVELAVQLFKKEVAELEVKPSVP